MERLTIRELRDHLNEHLKYGTHPDTPVYMRTKRAKCEADTDPVRSKIKDIRYNVSHENLYLDDVGEPEDRC